MESAAARRSSTEAPNDIQVARVKATPGQELELGFCFDEELYNELSAGGTGRMAEMFRKMKQDLEKREKRKKRKTENKRGKATEVGKDLEKKDGRTVSSGTGQHEGESGCGDDNSDSDADNDNYSGNDSDSETGESDGEDIEMIEDELFNGVNQELDEGQGSMQEEELNKAQKPRRSGRNKRLEREENMSHTQTRKRRRLACSTATIGGGEAAPSNPVLNDSRVPDRLLESPSGSSTTATSAPKFDINALVASVTSYGPEVAAFMNAKISSSVPTAAQEQSEQPQKSSPLELDPATDHFQHPCIHSHENRSTLTRDEHRRYLMYDSFVRRQHIPNPPHLCPQDQSLWASLQEKVDQERQLVRQWNAGMIRSRISSYYNAEMQQALETRFCRARERVREEYPRYYDFIQSIGLRLSGMPSAKEPALVRKQPNTPDTTPSGPPTESRCTGVLKRTGKLCPVSLAKPIWTTDENGVPCEMRIDISNRYWKLSDTSSWSTSQQFSVVEQRMSEQDFRRTHVPSKRPADSVTNDPTVQDFVKTQDIRIAVAASTLVTLAKALPGLESEWEIPVKVVLEEDQEGMYYSHLDLSHLLVRYSANSHFVHTLH